MPLYLLLQGMIIGLVVAVPFGPLGLLCINRALVMGPWCGLLSGFGVATADALAAGIAALGVSLARVHELLPKFRGWMSPTQMEEAFIVAGVRGSVLRKAGLVR